MFYFYKKEMRNEKIYFVLKKMKKEEKRINRKRNIEKKNDIFLFFF